MRFTKNASFTRSFSVWMVLNDARKVRVNVGSVNKFIFVDGYDWIKAFVWILEKK